MKPLFEDTDPEIERIYIEGIRKLTPAQKMRMIVDMNRTAYRLALADVKRHHPNETQREWDLRVASRYIPADLMLKAFGWDVEEKGY